MQLEREQFLWGWAIRMAAFDPKRSFRPGLPLELKNTLLLRMF